MGNLRVEELEPRHLLNATRWFLPLPLAESPVVSIVTIRVVEHVPLLGYGAQAAAANLSWCCGELTEIGKAAYSPPPGYVGRELETFTPPPQYPPPTFLSGFAAGLPDKAVSGLAPLGVDHPELSLNATAHPGNVGTNAGAVPLPLLEVVAGSRPAFSVPPKVAPPVLAETPIPDPTPQALDDDPIDVAVPVEERRVLPAVPIADVLTALPSVDLSALEQGMKQFLDQIEGVGQHLGGASGPGLYPWIAAMAAAAVACEVGRRQLKRPVEVSMPAASNLGGWPPEEPIGE